MPQTKRSATLSIPLSNGEFREVQLPIMEGSVGPEVLDIRKLYAQSGLFTYDPGFTSTASCTSSITFIDGDQGILLYRGYSIQELSERCSFMEVAYLLLHGGLPKEDEHKTFLGEINSHSMVHEQLIHFFRGFRRDAHPMAIMVGVVGALSAFYHDSLDIHDPAQRHLATIRLIAKMPTLAAMAYKYSQGLPFNYPQNRLDYTENFLHMLFSAPTEPYKINPVFAKALDVILTLHADHEQNASTSTVRIAGSSMANPFACIASGIASLWGPAHGGANEAVLRMLKEIGTLDQISTYIKKAKDPQDPFRLMGFGHRVYKSYDPRAQVLQKVCREVFDTLGKESSPLLQLAKELEKIALEDPYFVEKKLYPNVDFYSGILFEAMGIPVEMFTVFFAVARTTGWIAQWREMIEDTQQKIGRPRQLYTGQPQRSLS